jgi:hypothetical protein
MTTTSPRDRHRLAHDVKRTGQDNWLPRRPLSEAERFHRHGKLEPHDDDKRPRRLRVHLLALAVLAWLIIGGLAALLR